MVRLKEPKQTEDCRNGIFQFQSGSIKRYQNKPQGLTQSNFNSKVVRLKGDPEGCGHYGANRFQFQSGSIKSRNFKRKPPNIFLISIPKWFD